MLQVSATPRSIRRLICSGEPSVAPVRSEEMSRAGRSGWLLQRVHHVGRAVEDGAALGLDQPQRLAGVEVLLQHDAARVGHHREERVLAAEAPEERDREPEPVAGAQVQALADVPHVLDQGVVLELHALGQRRGAGGVEQVGHVLAAHVGLGAIDRRVVDTLRPAPTGSRSAAPGDRPGRRCARSPARPRAHRPRAGARRGSPDSRT